MIYVKNPEITEVDFVGLLNKAKTNLLSQLDDKKIKAIKSSPVGFETMVYEMMCQSSKDTDFDGHIVQTGAFAFPDIVARQYFGVEVKVTIADKWVSTGNSVLETTRVKGVEKIYMFFGKLGGEIEVRFRPYQECLYDVGVTHSPRYKIDMLLPEGKSIFAKMKIDYDVLRKEQNPIKKIKSYYRSQLKEGEELWWIDLGADEAPVSPVIKSFSKLEKTDKEKFITEAFIYFPEMFGNSNVKFERAAAYLITAYNAVSSSLRDAFTAGGQVELKVKNNKIYVPRMIYNLYTLANSIADKINVLDGENLSYYWRTKSLSKNRLEQWLKLLDKNSIWSEGKIKLSDVFKSGYDQEK